jgi:hypothetical protein
MGGRANVHDQERSIRPSAVSDDHVQSVDQKICERRRCTISEISHTVLYEIIRFRLSYEMFLGKMISERITGTHETQRMASALTF